MGIEFRKVCNPLLPSAQNVLAYLEVPDRTRWYANRGQLVCNLEERLSRTLGASHDVVTSTATGTAALEASILATVGRATSDKPFAIMPSYTFAATALAAEHCGYQPYFLDIDPETWALDPETVRTHPALAQTGVIVVVAPYGRLPDLRALEALQAELGVQVVVDAAAAFEQVMAAPQSISETVPMALSFHATKTYSTGEGGAVLWDSQPGRELISQATNFGFLNSRECRMAGFNGKMSEYHAAVGHAMLDIMDSRWQAYGDICDTYRKAFAAEGVRGTLFVAPQVSSAYALLCADSVEDAEVAHSGLQKSRFGWRRWYESGLHDMAHFRACPRDPMPETQSLSKRLLGLPMAPDLTPEAIHALAQMLAQAEARADTHAATRRAVLGSVRTAS